MELILVLVIGVAAIAFALFLMQNILGRDTGAAEIKLFETRSKKARKPFWRVIIKLSERRQLAPALLLFVLYAFLHEQSQADAAVAALAGFRVLI